MPSFRLFALALLLAPAAAQAAAPRQEVAQLQLLQQLDLRLASVVHRLVTANAPLCQDLQPAPGLVLHAADQYGDAAARDAVFSFPVTVAVEGLVPGSAAARAGVAAGDGVVAVNGQAVAQAAGSKVSSATRDAALALVAEQLPSAPVRLDLRRGGETRSVTLAATPGCRVLAEVLPGGGMSAGTDGRVLQIGDRMLTRFDDDALAAIVAHELSHVVLRHRARAEEARVGGGLLREFGRSGRLLRRNEREADQLSVALLRNAGYDPAIAPRFWRDHGREVDPGLFRSRIYDSPGERARALDAAIAAIPVDAPRPYLPPLLATRDRPLE